ncbi:carbohydrate ABC transporter permease [Paenibacillus sp. J2TS4]|uniref:carbohydrate ABC transporter permease n=1 Tax=Paenibacillus sp. J2TS4 TaxID=2807194 RepID=UPI001B0626BF|nr:sugar ABC transporter permease [Paenibacillus sp. J2TS4]GIP34972.1 sugar ABC transporter permease [Paenibacillus sp. J2TS4]
MSRTNNLNITNKKNGIDRKLKKNLWGYFFVLPEMVIFLIFVIIPILRGLSFSFLNYNVSGSTWVGLQNFADVFKDDIFWIALKNTSIYTVLVVPGGVGVALMLSWLIFPLSPKLQAFFKAAYYLPGVISGVVVALVWKWIMDPETGLLNYALSFIGLGPYPWLSHPDTALYSLVLIAIMGGQGAAVIIITANMGAIPASLYEAARIDGSSAWHQFRHITLPLLRPTLLYLFVVGMIGSYQVFESVYVLTGGGPYYSTTTIAYLIYSSAFDFFEFGKASAAATVLFVTIFILSLIQFYVFREDKK